MLHTISIMDLYLLDTPSCNEFYENFNEAIKEALSDYGARLDMFVCVSITESLEEVEKFPVQIQLLFFIVV